MFALIPVLFLDHSSTTLQLQAQHNLRPAVTRVVTLPTPLSKFVVHAAPKHKRAPVRPAARHTATRAPKVTVSLPTGPMQHESAIYGALRGMGLSPVAAAGVEGNLYQESHGDPHIYSPVGGGLFGLTNENGGSPNGGSLPYELHKLNVYIAQNGSIADVNAHATGSTPEAQAASAARDFVLRYERAGIPAADTRMQAAVHFVQSQGHL